MGRRKRISSLWILPLLLLTGAAGWLMLSAETQSEKPYRVESSRFEKWTPLSGRLEAASAITLRSELDGLSKLTWLMDDGTPVSEGEVVARFDPSELEEKKRIHLRDQEVASAEYRSLIQAEHPLELSRLEADIRQLEAQLKEENSLRQDTAELVKEELLPAGELERHDLKIESLQQDLAGLNQQLTLTKTVLHPALEQKAKARLKATRAALERVEQRLNNTEVRAPRAGTVYLPRIPIDSERRPARVGDGLYRNQVFMQLADLTELVVRSEIPEQKLSAIVPGLQARVRFPAFPQQSYPAVIRKVGTHPEGDQSRYRVLLQLNATVPMLRPGLTAEIEVLEKVLDSAVVIPRDYVHYPEGQPEVKLADGRFQSVRLGDGSPEQVVVIEGIEAGSRLLRP